MNPSIVIVFSLVCFSMAGPLQDSSSKPQIEERIIGGEITFIENIPYQLSLQFSGSHFCGATIISEDWAITSASCAFWRNEKELSLRAGSSTTNSGGTVHPVSQIIIHENYVDGKVDWDVALLKVSENFIFQKTIQPISLQPYGQKVLTGTPVAVSGWGRTSSVEPSSTYLKRASIKIISHEVCDKAYWLHGGITNRMICAGVPEGGKDACDNDTGGPLVTLKSPVLVGIVSWGLGCGSVTYPGVYTDISSIRDWVMEKISI